MRSLILLISLLLLSFHASIAWADDEGPALRDGDRWFIPVDVGVGPALHFLPGYLGGGMPETGLSLGLYAAVPPEVVQDQLKRAVIPDAYKGLVKNLDTTHEWHYRDAPITYIPDHFILSPQILQQGKSTSAYGVLWDPILLDFSLGLLGDTESPVRLTAGLGLPTLMALYVGNSKLVDGHAWIFGLGAQAHAQLTFRFSYAFSISAEWRSTLQVTNSYDLAQTQYFTGDSQRLWHLGTAMLLFHFRIPTYQQL